MSNIVAVCRVIKDLEVGVSRPIKCQTQTTYQAHLGSPLRSTYLCGVGWGPELRSKSDMICVWSTVLGLQSGQQVATPVVPGREESRICHRFVSRGLGKCGAVKSGTDIRALVWFVGQALKQLRLAEIPWYIKTTVAVVV